MYITIFFCALVEKQTVHHEQKINNAMTPKLAHPEILLIT